MNSGRNCVAKVDIIIPVYNQAQYVEDLLASLCAAHNTTPAEIIVIDDCSTEQSTKDVLNMYTARGVITLLKNQENMGFTRTVNRGMKRHRDRDVVLLNSDTIVHGDWLDRMAACAYSGSNIATVNPLTSQYGSHISCYPGLAQKFDGDLELSGHEIAEICAQFNNRNYVDVHTTVGFCMYIRRQSLNSIGYFDVENFPTAYGEESDFCYRARKTGWRHRVAGDAYVEHLEGKSFGKRKQELMQKMLSVFVRLHPDLSDCDRRCARQDPLLRLRKQVDLGRLRRLLRGGNEVRVSFAQERAEFRGGVALVLDPERKHVSFATELSDKSLPNIGKLRLPRDIVEINRMLQLIGVTRLNCDDEWVLGAFESLVTGQSYELMVAAKIQLREREPTLLPETEREDARSARGSMLGAGQTSSVGCRVRTPSRIESEPGSGSTAGATAE
jgi:GT2 family glycosyltransferase